MENVRKRQTEAWFVDQNFVGEKPFKSGPGAYEFQSYQNK